MPHVIVKLYAGKSDRQKALLAGEITKTVVASLGYGEDSVSVGIEDVEPEDWGMTRDYCAWIIASPPMTQRINDQ